MSLIGLTPDKKGLWNIFEMWQQKRPMGSWDIKQVMEKELRVGDEDVLTCHGITLSMH